MAENQKKKQVGLQPMSGVMGLDDSNSQTPQKMVDLLNADLDVPSSIKGQFFV